ncbi:MAG TPA: hypothetical protein VJP86_02705 [Vicinamibacterales bacterium]|nr:hypothetical protein [Vicinamibacterales bacterium]
MHDRRTFLGIAAASLLPVSIEAQTPAPASPQTPAATSAQTPTRSPNELARHPLTGALEGFEVVLVQLNNAAGARPSGPGHRHPGPVLGYVTEGQMLFAINNETAQVVQTGGTFFEPFGAVHTSSGSAAPDKAAKAVVFMIVPKGSPLTAPA